MSSSDVKILAVVGMCGSGKSVVIEHLTSRGVPKIYLGGLMYKAMAEAGVERTEDGRSEREFREHLREVEGKDCIVKRAIKEAKDLIAAGQKRIVLDGVYSWTEYKVLRKEFPTEMTVLAIVAPKALRRQRVATRPERPFDAQALAERDQSEIENLEKGGPIAIADYYINNNGNLDQLFAQLDTILTDTGFFA